MVLQLKLRESRSPPGHPTGSQNTNHTTTAGWSSPVARQAHNLKVTGSNPVPASQGLSQKSSLPPWPCPEGHSVWRRTRVSGRQDRHRDRYLGYRLLFKHAPYPADQYFAWAKTAFVGHLPALRDPV